VSPVSVVLRLLPGPAADGLIVGHAEVVATGEVVAIREVAALVELTRRLGAQQAAEAAGEGR
jgi:hypothetical protein